MAIKITFGNLKGGTGKTKNSTMIAYQLAKKGYKTLLIDMDPQGNATASFLKTQAIISDEIVKFDKTLMSAIADNDLNSIVTEISENLFLLPSYADFTSYPRYLESLYKESHYERIMHFHTLIEPLEDDFDFIILDVPPTISAYLESALMCSDYVIIVMQTQEFSLEGAKTFEIYLNELCQAYDKDLRILGVLPVLIKNSSKIDQSVLELAYEHFGSDNVFDTIVRNMERLKRYDATGISDPDNKRIRTDIHDKRVFKLYSDLTEDLIYRLRAEGVEM